MSFGYSTSLVGGTLLDTVTSALDGGRNSLQTSIFKQSFTPDDLRSTRDLLADSGFRFYSHTCVMLNPATPAPRSRTVIADLQSELEVINILGGTSVLHIGSETTGPTREGTLDNVITTLRSLPLTERKNGQRWGLLLENAAGEGRKLGSTLSDLEYLGRQIAERSLNVGFCLDTAHAFGAGLYDFSTPELIDEMFEQLTETLGPGRLQLIHLNDSKVIFGGKADRHENLGKGHIWKESLDPCKYLIKQCKERGIDMILETPASGVKDDYAIGCEARSS